MSTNQTVEKALAVIEKAVRDLVDCISAGQDRYDEGYRAAVDELMATIATRTQGKHPTPPVDNPSQKREQQTPTRLTAPNKDQLVREYLAANPGVRYRDINRALPEYTATRVYALEKRGEVRKDDDGRFYLIKPQ